MSSHPVQRPTDRIKRMAGVRKERGLLHVQAAAVAVQSTIIISCTSDRDRHTDAERVRIRFTATAEKRRVVRGVVRD